EYVTLYETYANITRVIESGDFIGKRLETLVLFNPQEKGPKRIILVGLGLKKDFSLETLRGAYARAAQQIRLIRLNEFYGSISFGESEDNIYSSEALTRAMVEGVMLGLYQFTVFKTVDRENIREVNEFYILEDREDILKRVKQAAKEAQVIATGVNYARDLISHPGNEMTPKDLAAEAMNLELSSKRLKTKILEAKDMQELGMNALLGVAKGSDEPPKLIIIEYRGGKRGDPCVMLVGKGLTFDSGGISLKPAEKMDEMKSDMAGGAAVMGAIKVAAELDLPLNIISLIPAVENLPSGKAYKPGDILKSLSNLTIEVVNTDAEGRLILADALAYAQRYQPKAIIDLATLTGACVVALGDNVAGLMGNNDDLKGRVKAAAEATSEKVWELPLWDEYLELIKSDVADFKNSGGRPAGAITAGGLLSKFVGKYPWVHLDIAGPAWVTKDRPYTPKGASGFGVRLLVQLLRDWPGDQ
ncbi:MAG: leucyl aminopeptidase, partial [Smithellaceae bacterium]|nr:leucyl aminopeptidase [Smithellaceae bacterium]